MNLKKINDSESLSSQVEKWANNPSQELKVEGVSEQSLYDEAYDALVRAGVKFYGRDLLAWSEDGVAHVKLDNFVSNSVFSDIKQALNTELRNFDYTSVKFTEESPRVLKVTSEEPGFDNVFKAVVKDYQGEFFVKQAARGIWYVSTSSKELSRAVNK